MTRSDVERALETLTDLAIRDIPAGLSPKNITITIPVPYCPGGDPQIVVTFNPFRLTITSDMLYTR